MWIHRATKRVLSRGGSYKASIAFGVPQDELTDANGKAVSNVHAIFYYGEPPALPPDPKFWVVPAYDAGDTTSEWVDGAWVGGRADSVVTEMTQAEKDAILQAEKDARNAAKRAILDDDNQVVRALALTVLDVVNGDIPGTPPYTEAQLLNYMANKIAEA